MNRVVSGVCSRDCTYDYCVGTTDDTISCKQYCLLAVLRLQSTTSLCCRKNNTEHYNVCRYRKVLMYIEYTAGRKPEFVFSWVAKSRVAAHASCMAAYACTSAEESVTQWVCTPDAWTFMTVRVSLVIPSQSALVVVVPLLLLWYNRSFVASFTRF